MDGSDPDQGDQLTFICMLIKWKRKKLHLELTDLNVKTIDVVLDGGHVVEN